MKLPTNIGRNVESRSTIKIPKLWFEARQKKYDDY